MIDTGPPLPSAGGPIVLGTDFGPASAAAERAAISRARAVGSDLVIVHAIEPGRLHLSGGLRPLRVDQVRARRERDAEALVALARAAGVSARVLIWVDDPATCVVEAARAEGAARIVVGTHGRGPIGRAIVGTISGTVASQAECQVEVIGPDAS